jgi:hypothetical protein
MNEYPDGGAVRADVAEPLSSVPAALPSNLPAEQSLLSAIVHVARDPQLDVAKLEALMRMQFEVEKRQAEKEFIEAFARLSSRLPRIKKEGVIDLGGKGKIAFARIEDMDKVIRPLLTAEGFTLSFDSSPKEGGGLVVSGHLMHSAGHSRAATIPLPLDVGPGRNSLQAVGSTLQYGKRYLTEMLLNLVREGADDDGIKGAMRFATDDEVAEIRKLLEETGQDEVRLCAFLNVAHLGELPVTSVVIARNMLQAKRKKQ